MTKKEKDLFLKLKAYFCASFFSHGDLSGPDYSTLTGGDVEGFSLEAINRVIDEFVARDGEI